LLGPAEAIGLVILAHHVGADGLAAEEGEAVPDEVRHALIRERRDGLEAEAVDAARHDAILDVDGCHAAGCNARCSCGVRKSICAQKCASSSVWPKSL
jgi:hypothetical protein